METFEAVEAFHIAFLYVLQGHADPNSFALKGGSNLRFYLDSLRYSEDIDLDTFNEEPYLFSEKIEKSFASPNLSKLLGSLGIRIDYLNPKDRTPTKEKWMVGLTCESIPAMVYTRVEVSHRVYNLNEYIEIKRMPNKVVSPYSPLPAPTIGHYIPRGALIQKTGALEERKETQPRDVFDLDYLFRKFPQAADKGLVPNDIITSAITRLFEISYQEYRSKVISFLDISIQAAYDSEDIWQEIQIRVADQLEEMKS